MAKGRFKDVEWNLANENGNVGTWERAAIAVLMDIRDELKRINARLDCSSTLRIPRYLARIATNTTKRKRKP